MVLRISEIREKPINSCESEDAGSFPFQDLEREVLSSIGDWNKIVIDRKFGHPFMRSGYWRRITEEDVRKRQTLIQSRTSFH